MATGRNSTPECPDRIGVLSSFTKQLFIKLEQKSDAVL
jgi:hypothetical protein